MNRLPYHPLKEASEDARGSITILILTALFWLLLLHPAAGEPPLIVTLEEAKELSLKNSKELQMVAFQLKNAKARFDLGIREYFPHLQAGFSSNGTVVTDSPDNSTHRLSLTVNQPLYNGGRTVLQRNLARTAMLLESSSYDRKQEEILDGIFNLFYKILILEEQKKLQNEIYGIAKDQLAITEKEISIGQIRDIDLLETELEVRSLEIQLKSSEITLEELYTEFNKAIGEEIGTAVSLRGSIDTGYSGIQLREPAEYYYQTALQNNIQFRKSGFEMRKSLEELKMSEKSFLPRIDSETTFNLSGNRLPLQDTGVTFKLNISFPMEMFPVSTSLSLGLKEDQNNRGTTANAGILEDITYPLTKKQAAANLRMMEIAAEELKKSFRFQIEKTLVKYQQQKESLDLKRQYLALQKRKIEIQEKQFSMGEIKRLDLLKSKSSLFKEEISLLEQILELINAERSFEILLGIEAGTLKTLEEQ